MHSYDQLEQDIARILATIEHQDEPEAPDPINEPDPQAPPDQSAARPRTINIIFVDEPEEEEEADPTPTVEGSVSSEPEAETSAPTPPTPAPQPQWRRPRVLLIAALCVCLLAVLSGAGFWFVPLWLTNATVTLTPDASSIAATFPATIRTDGTTLHGQDIPGRTIGTLTSAQTRTVATTGTGHQDAQAAQGRITFYNGLTQSQEIPAGTMLQATGGGEVVTDQDVTIPPAMPPTQGSVTVDAHALNTGPAGNITANAIYGPCCRAYVLAINHTTFTGGQDARTYRMVTQSDLDTAITPLQTSITQHLQDQFRAQVHREETLVTPVACVLQTSSDHHPGEEAAQVTVHVIVTCTGIAYNTAAFTRQIQQYLDQQATQAQGAGYTLIRPVHTALHIEKTTASMTTITVTATGSYAYQMSPARQQQFIQQIAGKSRAQAIQFLAQQPGVSAVSITIDGQDTGTLPTDPSRIHFVFVTHGQ